MQNQFDFRDRPLTEDLRRSGVFLDTSKHDRNKTHVLRLLLEHKLAEFRKRDSRKGK
jgi:hypothetical protein